MFYRNKHVVNTALLLTLFVTLIAGSAAISNAQGSGGTPPSVEVQVLLDGQLAAGWEVTTEVEIAGSNPNDYTWITPVGPVGPAERNTDGSGSTFFDWEPTAQANGFQPESVVQVDVEIPANKVGLVDLESFSCQVGTPVAAASTQTLFSNNIFYLAADESASCTYDYVSLEVTFDVETVVTHYDDNDGNGLLNYANSSQADVVHVKSILYNTGSATYAASMTTSYGVSINCPPVAPGNYCQTEGSYTLKASDRGVELVLSTTGDTAYTEPLSHSWRYLVPKAELAATLSFNNNDEDGNLQPSLGDTFNLSGVAFPRGNDHHTNVFMEAPITRDEILCPGPVAPGSDCQLNFTYEVVQTDIGNTLNPQVNATSDQGDAPAAVRQILVPVPTMDLVTRIQFVDKDFSLDPTVGDEYHVQVEAYAGPANLSGASLSEDLTGASKNCGLILSGESCLLEAIYTVGENDPGNDLIFTGRGNSRQTDEETFTVSEYVGQPDLSLTLSYNGRTDPDGSGFISVGDVLTFTATLGNPGETNLTQAVITNSLTSEVSACPAVLEEGQTCSMTIGYEIKETDLGRLKILEVQACALQARCAVEYHDFYVPRPTLSLQVQVSDPGDNDSNMVYSVGDTPEIEFVATINGAPQTGVELSNSVDSTTRTCAGPVGVGGKCSYTTTLDITPDKHGTIISPVGFAVSDQAVRVENDVAIPVGIPFISTETELVGLTDPDGNEYPSAGDTATVKFTAKNTGGGPLTNVVLDHNGQRTDCRFLDLRETCELVVTVPIGPEHVGVGLVVPFTATADQLSGPVQKDYTLSIAIAELGVTASAVTLNDLSGDGPSTGDIVEYSYFLTNKGGMSLSQFAGLDELSGQEVECVNILRSGDVCEMRVQYTISNVRENQTKLIVNTPQTGQKSLRLTLYQLPPNLPPVQLYLPLIAR